MPIPTFFDPAHARSWNYAANVGTVSAVANQHRRQYRIPPSTNDDPKTLFLIVDAQRDFCHPKGSLFVAGKNGRGAMDDCARMCTFIYRNPAALTAIDCTLDTHYPHQIFFAPFWIDNEGRPLDAHREITADQVRSGEVGPRPELAGVVCTGEGQDAEWLRRQALDYCERLEANGRYRLYLWPLHCLAGGAGHELQGIVQEARLFHAFLRSAPNWLEFKGANPLSENYSVLQPEVLTRHDGEPLAERNTSYLDRVLSFDRVVVAGQAASHCVRFTIDNLLEQTAESHPHLAKNIVLLEDCMSAVTVMDPEEPDQFLVDYSTTVAETLERYRELGIHVCRSTESASTWPDPVQS